MKNTPTDTIIRKNDSKGRLVYEAYGFTEHHYRYHGDTENIAYYLKEQGGEHWETEEQIYEDGMELTTFYKEEAGWVYLTYTHDGLVYRYTCDWNGAEKWEVRTTDYKDVSEESVSSDGVRTIKTFDNNGKLLRSESSNGLVQIRNEKGKLVTTLPENHKKVLATIHAAIKKNKDYIAGFCGMHDTPKLTNLSDKSGDKNEIVLTDSYHSASFTASIHGKQVWFSSYIRGNEDLCAGGYQSKWVDMNADFSVKTITDIARELGSMAKAEKYQHAANF